MPDETAAHRAGVRDVGAAAREDVVTDFGELVARYRDRVYRLVAGILGPGLEAEVEDIAQEAFLKAYRGLRSFRGESGFGSWLYRIVYNAAVERLRRVCRLRVDLSQSALERLPSVDRRADPERRAEGALRRRRLLAAIRELPPNQQAALRLFYWAGASIDEIASMTRSRPGTVKSWLHRARRTLHRRLEEVES